MLKKYTPKFDNTLMIPFHTNDSHKIHHTLLLLRGQVFFMVITQNNKHKTKMFNQCTYT